MRAGLGVLVCLAGPAFAQDGANPSFNLLNRGSAVITELYATPSATDRWGRDRLTQYTVPPGKTFPVRLPADGTCLYDLRVVYAGRPAEEARRVDVCRVDSLVFPGAKPGPATRAAAGSKDPSFRLINRGRAEVNEVYASPSGDDDWGDDRLGEDTVRAGASYVLRLPPGECTWDIRVVFANGNATERRRVDLCATTDLRVP